MNELGVAAYCRVSTNHEEQESGLETQVRKVVQAAVKQVELDVAFFVRKGNVQSRVQIVCFRVGKRPV